MDLIEEIAHRCLTATSDRVTDFYFSSDDTDEHYKVTETARPTLIRGGEVIDLRYDYVVSLFRNGWVEVARFDQEHVDDATVAAAVAERLIVS